MLADMFLNQSQQHATLSTVWPCAHVHGIHTERSARAMYASSTQVHTIASCRSKSVIITVAGGTQSTCMQAYVARIPQPHHDDLLYIDTPAWGLYGPVETWRAWARPPCMHAMHATLTACQMSPSMWQAIRPRPHRDDLL